MKPFQILLTNDDGIASPGLWAAAEALSPLGFVHVVAPARQSSGMGRSLPSDSSGRIYPQQVMVRGQAWQAFAVEGTPAQAVLHGLLEIVPHKPDLVVAGINYGENIGLGVTISGTVGAALEGAASGVPALAISLETEPKYHLTHDPQIDFRTAAHFARYFAARLLAQPFEGVDVLKVDVPAHATPETEWQMARLSRARYYEAVAPRRSAWQDAAPVGYRRVPERMPQTDTDAYVLRELQQVAVTPLSLDLTAHVDFDALAALLRAP